MLGVHRCTRCLVVVVVVVVVNVIWLLCCTDKALLRWVDNIVIV